MGRSSDGNNPPVIALFGLGTIGDILPLLKLAKYILAQSCTEATEADADIIFVTQIFHEATVQSFFPIECTSSGYSKKFSVNYVQSKPIGLNFSDKCKIKGDVCSKDNESEIRTEKKERDSFYSLEELNLICVKIASTDTLRLVIANLFCLVGCLVAEKKGIRCLLIHPHNPPSKQPSDYQSVLKRGAPIFYQQLFRKSCDLSPSQQDELYRRSKYSKKEIGNQFLPSEDCRGNIYCPNRNFSNWQDYDEWLWPTLSPMYDSTRTALHLPHFSSKKYRLPLAPVVLLTVSPKYLPSPGYWPVDRYIVIGYMRYEMSREKSNRSSNDNNDDNNNHGSRNGDISDKDNMVNMNPDVYVEPQKISPIISHSYIFSSEIVEQFISRQSCDTICIDFGSMTELIINEFSLELFCCTLLKIEKFSFIILCHGYIALFQTCLSNALKFLDFDDEDFKGHSDLEFVLQKKDFVLSERLCLVNKFIDHSHLFKKCVGILHHGGAGTVGCCLSVGIPQG